MKSLIRCLALALLSSGSLRGAEEFTVHSFQRIQLSDQFFCEGASYGDFNRDGATDVVAGPFWYAGPTFAERRELYAPVPFDIASYSENFLCFTHDVNGDGWTDIFVVGWPGKESWWFENPQGKPGHWPRHVVLAVTDNESPAFTDITGDGRPELVCTTGGQLGYAEIPKEDPTQPWTFRAVSPNRGYERYMHGLGVGDVNNDGRTDILEKNGWYEQPPADARVEFWTFHRVAFSEPGGAQMLVYDIDGDGDNDIVTSKAAHAYGLAWFENTAARKGDVDLREHKIMGERADENEYGIAFSQLHALALVDMDRDGVPDVVTGKRFWAHAENDPGALEPAVLYWFRTVREGGTARFVPYKIDSNSGVGTQVEAGDLNGDQWPDVVVGNKKGTFVFLQQAEQVGKQKWEAAQPVRQAAPRSQAAATPTEGELSAAAQPTAPQPAASAPAAGDGYPAKAADGRVLNLDLEAGDLSDWEATGDAFNRQPVAGDTVHARRNDSVSGHRGRHWIGTYEVSGDDPQGTLTSAPFPATHAYASFLVGGGAGGALRVEIVRRDTDDVIFAASGRNSEEMRTVVADLREVGGKEIFIRIVDHGSAGWGHINFDHFRLHDEPPKIAAHAAAQGDRQPDTYPHAGLPAAEAAREMKVPPGFSVTVAAAEPDVKQPIAMAYDDRGRLWVAEAYEYPVPAEGRDGRDRILIFEDADGDGRFDKRTVFAEKLNLVSGLEVGFGGVWVGAAPYLLFIPDRNGDDVPDAAPEILLDGWAWQDTHETLNTFIWGPDGWLYGCHGVFTHSRVGKPGAPDAERTPLNAAIWRYHPTRHKFEIFAEGTSNPWGVDFDDHGQAFCTACVIPHLYHIIQGARYQRQAGNHFNPYTYADIATIADHRHYLGDSPHGGNGRSDDAGGGHAHAGAMIYLGGLWPDEFRGRIFMNNIHGQRLNTDILKPSGSGFVGSHGPDFLLTGDIASQILNIRYGPDGNAYFIDWYDTNACHHNNVEGHDRTNGRVYKAVYSGPSRWQRPAVIAAQGTSLDLKKLSEEQLTELVLEKNDWYVRHARRILQERASTGKLSATARQKLSRLAIAHPEPTVQLRAMWALHVTGGLPNEIVSGLLGSREEYVRAWAVQLALERENPNLPALRRHLVALAQSDPSQVVRLYLASALQRLPLAERWNVLDGLVRHAADAADQNLPLMYWYAAEPLAEADPERALALALSCGKTIPLVREFLLRRIGSLDSPAALGLLVRALGRSQKAEERLAILQGIDRGLTGRRRVEPPAEWAGVYRKLAAGDDRALRAQVTALGVKFGDPSAMSALRKLVSTSSENRDSRVQALQSLLAAKDPGLPATLFNLLADADLRREAIAGLALYDDPQTPTRLLAIYASLPPDEKRTALATLAARGAYGIELLNKVAAKEIPLTDLSADLVRQLSNLHDAAVDKLLAETWGQVRPTAADKARLIADHRRLLTREPEIEPDLQLGRAIFGRTCQQCHTLYGVGEKIGPDLTGSNRADAEYLLANVFDPSGLIAKEYQSSVVITTDGRVVTGLITSEDDRSLTIRTATESLVIPKDEVDERTLSDVSVMPDDQLRQFSKHEILSLFAYLRDKEQVPMLATPENASLLFNGRGLKGWTGDPQLWSVEDAEIVGRTAGLNHNTFLVSDLAVEDFRLSLEVKLVNDAGNSGIQFRSQPIEGFTEIRGYQADIGPTWWGKLYEENARALLWDKSGEAHVKRGDWNRYEIEAIGSRIRTWINGNLCVDLDDPDGARRGILALQLHSGDATEVRFRDLQLEVK